MSRVPPDTSAEEPDGGNLQVRFRRGPGLGDRPRLLNKPFDIRAALSSIGKLEISESTTAEEAGAAMKILASFNQCMVGLVSFSGLTPWERHPDDELLHILEGEVDVRLLLAEGGEQCFTLHADSVFIVPANLWHNQFSRNGTKLLFVTSQQGNEESTAEDPRQ